MNTGQWIAVGLSALFVLWFAGAYLYNRRRGEDIGKKLRASLKQLGEPEAIHRIGTPAAGGRVAVGRVEAPFKQLEVFYLLEARENLPLWLYTHLKGKRDMLILRGNFHKTPVQEVQVGQTKDRDFRRMVASEQRKPFELAPGPDGFQLARRGRKDEQALACLKDFLEQYRDVVQRVSIQSKEPHLYIQAYLPPIEAGRLDDYFAKFAEMVKQLSG